MVIEPYETEDAHVRVQGSKTNIIMLDSIQEYLEVYWLPVNAKLNNERTSVRIELNAKSNALWFLNMNWALTDFWLRNKAKLL